MDIVTKEFKCYIDNYSNTNGNGSSKTLLELTNISSSKLTIESLKFKIRSTQGEQDFTIRVEAGSTTKDVTLHIKGDVFLDYEVVEDEAFELDILEKIRITRVSTTSTIKLVDEDTAKKEKLSASLGVNILNVGFNMIVNIEEVSYGFDSDIYLASFSPHNFNHEHYGEYEDRDWYKNLDIWEYPLLHWIQKIPIGLSSGYNIYVKHQGKVKKVQKVYVYKQGVLKEVQSVYVYKNNKIIRA